MNKNKYPRLLFCGIFFFLCISNVIYAQGNFTLRLRTGAVNVPANASEFVTNKIQFERFKAGNTYNLLVQFNDIPTNAQKQAIAQAGIVLGSYVPDFAFSAVVPEQLTLNQIAALNIRAFIGLEGSQKLGFDPNQELPDWAFSKEKNTIKLTVVLHAGKDMNRAEQELKELGGVIINKSTYFNMIDVIINQNKVKELSATAWSSFITLIDAPNTNSNVPGMAAHRSNILRDGVRGLNGEGIRVGIWDETVRNHLDFGNRVTIGESFIFPDETWHGTHVAGTMAGSGLLNPNATGAAPRASIFGYNFLDNNPGQPNGNRFVEQEVLQAINTYGITVTQNSWGPNVTSCNQAVAYSASSVRRDILSYNFPNLQTNHAAGNSQGGCASNAGFGTLGDKSMKNSLVVANVTSADVPSTSSSYGPTSDGRIKPDISAVGSSVFSTAFFNTYGTISGTSMACPGVSGLVMQLAQRFKQLNRGTDPRSSLLRALICNNADDIDNPGPDYRTGWGRLNGLNAVRALEENRYVMSDVAQGNTRDITVTVPAGTAEFEVMLAWTDPAGLANSAIALVNNLDLQVIDPNGVVNRPWRLNPATPAANAVVNGGVDNINNIEQVFFATPVAGTYTIRVIGSSVPVGPQEYALTWTAKGAYREVIYPSAGNVLDAGTTQVVVWDRAGTTGTQTVEFSLNGGGAWTALTGSPAAATAFNLSWAIPAGTVSDNALIAINRLGAQPAISGVFSIIGVPANFLAKPTCGGIDLSWNAVGGATSYEVLALNQATGVWTSAGTTAGTTLSITNGLVAGTEYFYAVRARTATIVGSRSQAISAIAASPLTSISVINSNDDGNGSLRDAINRICDGGTITFEQNVSEVILTSGQLIINKNITINGGSGNRNVTVARINSTDFNTPGFRILYIAPNANVAINNLTIRRGVLNQIETNGAGIWNNGGTLALRNCYILENTSPSGISAIANGNENGFPLPSTITMTNCVVAYNIANTSATAPGATIQNGYIGSTGNLTMVNCTFTDNIAGADRQAVRSRVGTLTMQNNIFNIGAGTTIASVSNFGAPDATATSLGGNIVSDNSAASATVFNNASDLRNTNPLLNGFGLCGCSPAVNTGNPAGAAPATDLLGLSRVGIIDRGALEYLGTPIPANQQRITVNSSANDGVGSLREAIFCLAPDGVITFGSISEVVLTTGELLINKALTIDGGLSRVTIRRSNAANTPLFRVINVTAQTGGNRINLNNLNITNGRLRTNATTNPTSAGGGILASVGVVNINNSIISNNSARLGGGIAVFSTGTVNSRASMINNNNTISTSPGTFEDGPGIYVNNGRLDLVNTAVTNNRGSGNPIYGPSAGIAVEGGSSLVTMTNTTIAGNGGAVAPYGAFTQYGSLATFSKNTVYANPAVPNIVLFAGQFITEGGNVIADRSVVSSPNNTDKLNTKVFFANPESNDYRLACYNGEEINSAINAGVVDPAVTADILGRQRASSVNDAGAYIAEGDCDLLAPVLSARGGNTSAQLSWRMPDTGLGTLTYEVYMLSNNSPATLVGTTSQTTYTVTGLRNTETYIFYVVAGNLVRRSDASNRVTIRPSIVLSAEEDALNGSFNVYPNPSTGDFTLYFDDKTYSKDLRMKITSITGQEVYSKELSNGSIGVYREAIDLSNYASGIYFLSIEGEKVSVKKKLNVVR